MGLSLIMDWPADTRLNGVANAPEGRGPGLDGLVSLHLIDLADGQQGSVELTMASGHLPFVATSINGTYPDGSQWLMIAQVGLLSEDGGFDDPETIKVVLDAQLQRYLRLNPAAVVRGTYFAGRGYFLRTYEHSGVDPTDLGQWSLDELLAGWVCELFYVDLADLADGYVEGCAFPQFHHLCTGNVFTDVFARWSLGLLQPPEPDPDEMVDDDAEIQRPRRRGTLLRPTAPEVRAVTLGVSRQMLGDDWSVRAAWIDDVFYIGHCDYGDGPDTTWGMDVADPIALLSWLMRDQISGGEQGIEEFLDEHDVVHGGWVFVGRDAGVPPGLSVVRGYGHSVVIRRSTPAGVSVCDVADGAGLLLTLLESRFASSADWESIVALMDEAVVPWQARDRGYV